MFSKILSLATFLTASVHSMEAEFLQDAKSGYIDSHIKSIKKDGRDPEVRSAFEQVRMA